MTKNEYLEMVKQAQYYADLYYNHDAPEISDYEYDALTRKIKTAEKEHPEWVTDTSPTQHVGGVASSTFEKVKHSVPMLSLEDVFDESAVEKFVSDFPGSSFSTEYKIDGLSASLTYVNNELVRGLTRGNGEIGEDVTENIKCVRGIPQKISSPFRKLVLRGEVYLPVAEFDRINAQRELTGEKLFVNPRNAAAGLLRTKNGLKEVAAAGLRILIFNVQEYELKDPLDTTHTPTSHTAELDALEAMGFEVVAHKKTDNVEDTLAEVRRIGTLRGNLPFWIDGAVVKLDDIRKRDEVGSTAKYPRWAVAFKYPPEEKATVINNIVLQCGRTGRITPVAEFDPIFLEGSKVSRATLNNPEFIQKLGVNIGDEIIVHKAASIIPEIMRVSKKGPNAGCYDVLAQKCPSCGGALCVGADDNGDNECGAYCANESGDCPAQLSGHIEFWCSRDCMDIPGMGPALIDKFIEAGWIRSVADIYRLKDHADEIAEMDGLGKKTADKLIAAIEASKDRDIDRLIKGLGILGIGRSIGKVLAKKCQTLWDICNMTEAQLRELDGVGEISASVIHLHFSNHDGFQSLLHDLEDMGVNFTSKSFGAAEADGKLSGMTFVITGTLPSMSRDEAKNFIEANGGKVSGSVSKNTTCLLAGEAAGSKLTKAQELGTKIISEAELRDMVQ